MKTRLIALASAAAAMVAAPVAANTAVSRSAAPVEGEQELSGGTNVIIALLAIAAVVAGIILIADDEPTSP